MRVIVDARRLKNAVNAVSLAAGRDVDSSQFTNVLLRYIGGSEPQLHIVATDSHVMAVWRERVKRVEGVEHDAIAVDAIDLRRAVKKSHSKYKSVGIDIDFSNGSIGSDVVPAPRIETRSANPFTFPPYEPLFTTQREPNPSRVTGFDLALVRRVCKMFRRGVGTRGYVGTRFDHAGGNNPLFITSTIEPSLTVVLMPLTHDHVTRGYEGPLSASLNEPEFTDDYEQDEAAS